MRKSRIGMLLILVVFLSSTLAFAATPAKIRIAVLPFKLGQTTTWWDWSWDPGTGISDMVVTDLVNTGNFSVYERERLEEVLGEQVLGQTGLVDASTAASLGKLLGVQVLLMGTVTRFDLQTKSIRLPIVGEVGESTATVQLDLRLVDVETGEIISALRGDGQDKARNLALGSLFGTFQDFSFESTEFHTTILGKATTTAVGQVVKAIVDKTKNMEGKSLSDRDISGLVADVTGKEVTITVGKKNKVQKDDVFQVQRKTKEIKDPTTGAVIRIVKEDIAQIKITEVYDGASVGIITKTETGKTIAVGDLVELVP
jgi:curli biogenesis system outer membrane secretion channel CsgG